jgi:hypothetical protein
VCRATRLALSPSLLPHQGQSGASTKELTHRMGHGSMRAALIYQHKTDERAREIAVRLNEVVAREARRDDDDGASGELVPSS